MKYRTLGKTNVSVSEVSLGTWQLGSKWGAPFNEEVANETLLEATKHGINCYDTADVYQGGQSEIAIGKYIKNLDKKPFVITKIGRQMAQTVENYSEENIRKYIDDSRNRLDMDALDLVLLHCPPTALYDHKEVFDILDQIKTEGKIKQYGVSIEKVEEGLKAITYPGVAAIEVIFNMFRLKPMETLFEEAKKHNVGIIVRVPLASGLLTGKYRKDTTFGPHDHRTNNRHGELFDKGETFSGVDYDLGLKAVEALKEVFHTDNLTQLAIRWTLMFDAVSTVIPGASKASYVKTNAESSELPPLSDEEMKAVENIYQLYIKSSVHDLW